MKRSNQLGMGLVELLISSAFGLIVLATVTSVFLKGQQLATKRAQELGLLQNTTSVLQMLRSDVQRAGYDGSDGLSLKLVGADSTIFSVSNANQTLLAYAYLSQVSGGVPYYKNVVYEQRGQLDTSFYICERDLANRVINIVEAQDFSNQVGPCNNLFDENWIHLNSFQVANEKVEHNGVKSAFLTVNLSVQLAHDSNVNTSLSFTIKQRNWQE